MKKTITLVALLVSGVAMANSTMHSDSHNHHSMMNHAMMNHSMEMSHCNDMQKEMAVAMNYKDADELFAGGMIPHHKGALAMADMQLANGKDPEMLALAKIIKEAQDPEIKLMDKWLKDRNAKTESAMPNTEMHKASMVAMEEMNKNMAKAMEYSDPDVQFAVGMIAHHQGAVKMAEIELKYGKDKAMRELATNIISAQNTEIEQMNKWLDKKEIKR